MITDILTVVRKEWIENFDQFSRFKRGGWTVVVVMVFLGVLVPLELGAEWGTPVIMFLYWPFLAASMTSTVVSDAIAGERERHTLETLLSTRLSDTSILIGKLIAAVSYGLAFAASNLLIGWVTLYFTLGPNVPRISVTTWAPLFALVTAVSAGVASLGVFVSMRAATVRQAQQLYGILLLVFVAGPGMALPLAPEAWRLDLSQWLQEVAPQDIAWRAAGVLMIAATLVLAIAVRRFKRGQLSLD